MILITGADGYIGSRVAKRLLELTDQPLLLWMRSVDSDELARKKQRMERALPEGRGRITYAWGDLRDPDPFASLESWRSGISGIIHSASVIEFNLDAKTADEVNRGGTRKSLDFASKCPRLESYSYLSTVYASGLRAGTIAESRFGNEAGFSNHYERSKWESEILLFEEYAGVPWRIFRISTAIADRPDGAVSQRNAFHNTLKLLYYGLVSLVPGSPDTPLYFTTASFASDAIARLCLASEPRSIFHVCHNRRESLTLSQLLDVAFGVFEEDPAFLRRRILRPLLSDQESFDLLAGAVDRLSGGVVSQAVGSMVPFSRQLFVSKTIENTRLVSALPDYRAPDPRELIRNTVSHLLRTQWGMEAAS